MDDQTALPLGEAGGEFPEAPDSCVLALDLAVAKACLPGKYGAAVRALRSVARAIDLAERQGKPQVTAQLAKSYLDGLARLGLAPQEQSRWAPPEDTHLSSQEGTGAGLGGYSGPTLVDAAPA